jgi:hypothetical protein
MSVGSAQAQYFYPGGYGGYGWGGWGGWGGGGSTFQGDVARGLGAFAAGAGQYNLESAQAASIDTDTVMRWNQYMFLSQQETNQREYQRMEYRLKRDASVEVNLYKRFRDNPTELDILHGDALNVILDQLSDPRIHASSLRLIDAKISGDLIDDIPFTHASDAVTLSLHRLINKDGWPFALRDDQFKDVRKGYQDAIQKAIDEDEKGDLKPQTVQNVVDATSRLWAKFEESPPDDHMQRVEAENYIKGLMAMSKMLSRPNVDKIIAELEKVQTTTAGHLIAFMQAFNLRFGKAETNDEKAAYRALYAMLDPARDRVLKGIEETPPPPVASHKPTDFFRDMRPEHVGKKKKNGDDNNNDDDQK